MTEEKQIQEERQSQYGNTNINMEANDRLLESMLMQALQLKEVNLPSGFSCMFMAGVKILRECYKHKEDNGLDAANYLDFGRKMGRGEDI
jgi:hypothetical protein